jgi:broad specificity phosphatase PhoE
MSKIYIARHGETDWNARAKLQGQTAHVPLNDKGKEQALALLEKCREIGFNEIHASDLARAKETAEILNDDLGLGITFDKRLREVSFGDWEGRIFHDISKDEWARFNENPKAFNAETHEEVSDRMKSFLDEIRKKAKGNVLVVSHGGALKVAIHLDKYGEFKKKEFLKDFLVPIKNAGLIELAGGPANQTDKNYTK